MDMRVLISVLVPWVFFCFCALKLVDAQKGYTQWSLCDVQGCNCTIKAGKWKNVNCVLDNEQELILKERQIPKEAFEISILGGKSITFSTKTFFRLPALTFLHMESIRNIVMEKKSFFDIHSSSFLLQINGCDNVLIKTNAFDDMKSSLSTEITKISTVTIEDSAFMKLSNSTFKDIGTLNLAERTFEVKNQGPTKDHGPAIVVIFINVKIPEIQNGTFLTALAQLTFHNCQIGIIHSGAVVANEISALTFFNSTIREIRAGAFTERVLIVDFRISKCYIRKIETGASRAAINKLFVEHSNITTIEPQAIVGIAAEVQVIGNQIANFQASAFVFQNWNNITFEENFINELHSNFIDSPLNSDGAQRFSFKSNVIYHPQENSLNFISKLHENPKNSLIFNDNLFEEFCNCNISSWIDKLVNSSGSLKDLITENSFCRVNDFLSKCYSLPVGLINMKNFTETPFCLNNTICETYSEDTTTLNTAIFNNTFFNDLEEDDISSKQSWLIFIIVVVGAFIIALIATSIALLIRGSRWLKRKGYFRNMHYSHNSNNQRSTNGNDTDEENTIVTMDENEKLEVPEELTLEFLQTLSQRLDDPSTHQEASEMIERLYEMFIVDDSNYDNNNRQLEEEAHLYEELGNLNLQIPPPPYEEEPQTATNPRGILKMIEEKVSNNTNANENTITASNKTLPAIVSEYSEPNDVAVHFYSELRQRESLEASKNESLGNLENVGNNSKDSLKSSKSGSGSMALRPLPNKPASIFDAGPSKL